MAKRLVFLSFLLFSQIFSSFAQIPCTWNDGKGNKYDLSPLTNNAQDYFLPKNPANQPWDVWINVCRPTLTIVCGTDVAGCQEWDSNSPNGHASMGKASSAVITPPAIPGKNGWGVTIQYTGGSQVREMEIDLFCDPNAGIGFPAYNGENPQFHYNFKWASTYACPAEHCSSFSSCISCATTGFCEWCLDNSTCITRNSTSCLNFIRNKDYCPNPCKKFTTCETCTDGSNNELCVWCLDNRTCFDVSDVDCQNQIRQKNFCPRKKINDYK